MLVTFRGLSVQLSFVIRPSLISHLRFLYLSLVKTKNQTQTNKKHHYASR